VELFVFTVTPIAIQSDALTITTETTTPGPAIGIAESIQWGGGN
jgi:hypothetical protein